MLEVASGRITGLLLIFLIIGTLLVCCNFNHYLGAFQVCYKTFSTVEGKAESSCLLNLLHEE
jgi:succinate dehydrogenase hydrophobic anchor subunit